MYPKTKSSGVPSDAQSKEKLAVYVYEYLIHIGAQKTATSFLQEIRWDKSISVGEPPGFLHSWWNAAPERRDTHEHSSEAKAFHDYGFVNSGYPNGLPHPGHPIMSGSAGVGGPSSNSGPGMPPPLGPPAPDPVSMRQRPTGPMLPGGGLPPGAGPGIPSPHHPSMRFHQAGGYPGPPSGGGGMMPQHANLIPGGGPLHPMHAGPMLPQHHHHPGAMMSGHRARWMGPGMPQQSPSGGPGQSQQAPIVGPGSVGPNSVSSAGPSSVGPGSCGAGSGPGGNTGGIVQSPSHPGTPNAHLPPTQHLASPSPLNNQNNCHPTTLSDHQSCGSGLPPGHPHHPTPPHYVVGQQPQQQQTPPSSNACIPPEYSTRPSPHMVFGGGSGGPGSTPEGSMFGAGESSVPSGSCSGSGGNLPPRSSGMLPPPPPEYTSGGVPPVSSGYPSGSDLKASPLHGNPSLSNADILGGISAMTPDYPSVSGGNGNGVGPAGTSGFGPTSDSQMMMMMPPPHQQSSGGIMQSQQHLVSGGGCQGQAPPPPQYVHSGSNNSAPLQSSNGGSGSGAASSASPSGGPGSVQFPQEYSFNQIS